MPLVETDWLGMNLNKVKIIDCSWHMPQTKRDGFTEYKTQHIQNYIFFDLDNNSKKDSELPHMLVEISDWEKIVSRMGIKKNDEIVVYDNINDLADKINFYSKNNHLRKKIAMNGQRKYFKLFNEKRVSEYFVNISVGKKFKLF